MKAFVRNGVVGYVETRTPLENLVHPDFLPFFVPVPAELEGQVAEGWLYADGIFSAPPEPEPEPLPELPPEATDDTAAELAALEARIAEIKAQMAKEASAT